MNDSLKKAGYSVESFGNPVVALEYFDKNGADLLITDIRMPDLTGFEVLEKVKQIRPETEVVMMTAYGTIQSAVDAMKKGAFDYITKPFSTDQLLMIVKKLEQLRKLEEENTSLRKRLEERYSFQEIIGKSKIMQELYDHIETVADSDMTILIQGESGTGKELVANAIHANSPRKNNAFVKLGCGALNDSLLESELFGHVKGSFTGAIKDKKGKFEIADGGTLFLDDVDDMPLNFQIKLLRVLQEKTFERVGSNNSIKVDVRIICATKVDLIEKVHKNQFREDLFYRISVVPLKLPPLRDRKEDINLLVHHFLSKIDRDETTFSPDAIDALNCFNWPGNIRQLENAVYRIVALNKSKTITPAMIPTDLLCFERKQNRYQFTDETDHIDLNDMIDDLEREAVQWALKKADGNQSKAAALLKLKRTTLRDKLKKFDMV